MKQIKRALALTALFLASTTSVVSAADKVGDFSFKDVDGQAHKFSEYRGKWVIANYWATYCGPCVAELPALNSIAKKFKDQAVVLGLEAGETPLAELKQFAEQKKLTYTVAPTQDSTMFSMGLLYGVPTTFIIDPQGRIVDTHMGAITAAQLQNYIRSNDDNAAQAKDKKADGKESKQAKESCDTGVC
ncbi:MAG: hypothetical protein RI964_2194 [Pseudomonadota bacterium]|jgi:peroxiredoxin